MRITSGGRVGIGTTNPTLGQIVFEKSGAQFAGLCINNTTSDEATIRFKSTHDANSDYRIGASILVGSAFEIYSVAAAASRLVITSGGSVGVGVTPKTYASTWAAFQVGNFSLMGPNPSTDPNAILGANSYRATDNTWKRIVAGYANLIEFNQGNGDIRTYTGGTSTADSTISFVNGPFISNGGVSWTNGSSDVRKKKNFETTQGLAEVLQIEPIKYHFNWEEDDKPKRLGFKAQNLQTLIPEMVIATGETAEDGSDYLTVTPDYLLPVLVKALQEANAKITALEEKLERNNIL